MRSPTTAETAYDAVLVLSFGGPEGPDDVIPFLENVLRGRDVPRERLEAVAEHYLRFGGVSPINAQNRSLVTALEAELAGAGIELPVYWGNRNWRPLLADTLDSMRRDGIRRALAFVTSAYSSYSGCRQYLDDIVAARTAVGPGAPVVDKLRAYFDHPGFVEAAADGLRGALETAGPGAPVLFSAHSIPVAMAKGCAYQAQLLETARLVAAAAGIATPAGLRPAPIAGGDQAAAAPWSMVFQSRSGSPSQPWLGPDVTDAIAALPDPTPSIVVAPIGFVSDHMEVVYDLDTEAAAVAARRGVRLVRAATAGTHPAFVAMIRQLVNERLDPASPRQSLSPLGPAPDHCPAGHCPPASSRPAPPGPETGRTGRPPGASTEASGRPPRAGRV